MKILDDLLVFLELFCDTNMLQNVPGRVWAVGKLNHVAIAVPDLEKSTAMYRDILGAKVSEAHVCINRC
jgi:methylmalonyl-CoA/ethylmalonyl-CoA epimerase